MHPGINEICGEVLSALFNGTYQGVFLAALVLGCLRCLRSANAATRHAILLGALMVVAFLPVAHLTLRQWAAAAGVDSTEAESQSIGDGDRPRTNHRPGARLAPDAESVQDSAGLGPDESVRGGHRPSTEDAVAVIPSGDAPAGRAFRTAEPVSPPTVGSAAMREKLRFPLRLTRPLRWHSMAVPHRLTLVAFGLWLAISGALLARLLWQVDRLRVLKRKARQAAPELTVLFGGLVDGIGSSRRPRLLVSDGIQIPMAAGLTRPAVLLPADLAANPSVESLLPLIRHELAHLTRRDDWANLAQLLVQSVFFFHPAVWWLSGRLAVEREIACDDQVLQSSWGRREYALLLAEFVHRRSGRRWLAASAAWSSKSQLKERIDMILNATRNTSPRLARTRVGAFTACAVVLALIGLRAGPRVALGGALPTTPAAPAKTAGAEGKDASENAPEVPVPVPVATPDAAPTPEAGGEPRIGDVESGPRAKAPAPGVGVPTPLPTPVIAPPAASAPVALAATLPAPAAASAPEALAATPEALDPARDLPRGPIPENPRQRSLEERLRRLEDLVHDLTQRHPAPRAEGAVASTGDLEGQMAKLEAQLRELQMRRDVAQAEREAAKQAEQAVREAMQAQKDALREADEARREAAQEAKDAQEEARREALEADREAKEAQEEARRDKLEAEREARDAAREKARISDDKSNHGGNKNSEAWESAGKDLSHVEAMRRALIREQADLKRRLSEIERQLGKLEHGGGKPADAGPEGK